MSSLKPKALAQLSRAARQLFPCVCMFCEKTADDIICAPCKRSLQSNQVCCRQCAERLPTSIDDKQRSDDANHLNGGNGHNELCGQCLSKPPAFSQTIVAFPYEAACARLIHAYKFKEQLLLSSFFAQSLGDAIKQNLPREHWPDVLLATPLHPSRLRARGFNQSHTLAKLLGKQLGIPVLPHALKRRRATPPQTGLSRKAREQNIKSAFEVAPESLDGFANKKIGIVDDVITTGATMRAIAKEVAKALKPAQAQNINVFAIAKTQRS